MRKIAPLAFLTAGFLVFGGLLASPAVADDEDLVLAATSNSPRQSDDDSSESETENDDDDSDDDDSDEDESDAEKAEEEAKHKELREKYGDDGKMMLPPLVIKPNLSFLETYQALKTQSSNKTYLDLVNQNVHQVKQASLGGFIAVNPREGTSKLADVVNGKSVNPEQNAPIEISSVNFEQKPSVDEFIGAAKTGLGVMLAGVLALGLVAGYRAIRHK